jgi:integrase
MLLSTGITINPKLWSKERNRVKASATNASLINSELDKIETSNRDIYNKAIINGIDVSPQYLKEKYYELTNANEDKIKVKKELFDYLNEFIEIRKNDINYSPDIINKYRTTYNHLRNFKPNLTFDGLDEDFEREFTNHFVRENITDNLIGSIIKTLKTFCRWCFNNGNMKNTAFMKYKVHKRDSDTVALTFEEVQRIENADFSKNNKLNNVRNILLIQCYTGLRFSDLISLKQENFDMEDKVIKLQVHKT